MALSSLVTRSALLLLAVQATVHAETAASDAMLAATPLTRDQTAAFYLARNLSPAAVSAYAGNCVLSLTFRNDGATALRTRLEDWTAGEDGRFRLPTEWEAKWDGYNLPQTARIAFRWAQFPAEQEFEPGDWIMGMATLERRMAGRFRITARYSDEKGKHELVTEAIACAD